MSESYRLPPQEGKHLIVTLELRDPANVHRVEAIVECALRLDGIELVDHECSVDLFEDARVSLTPLGERVMSGLEPIILDGATVRAVALRAVEVA